MGPITAERSRGGTIHLLDLGGGRADSQTKSGNSATDIAQIRGKYLEGEA